MSGITGPNGHNRVCRFRRLLLLHIISYIQKQPVTLSNQVVSCDVQFDSCMFLNVKWHVMKYLHRKVNVVSLSRCFTNNNSTVWYEQDSTRAVRVEQLHEQNSCTIKRLYNQLSDCYVSCSLLSGVFDLRHYQLDLRHYQLDLRHYQLDLVDAYCLYYHIQLTYMVKCRQAWIIVIKPKQIIIS